MSGEAERGVHRDVAFAMVRRLGLNRPSLTQIQARESVPSPRLSTFAPAVPIFRLLQGQLARDQADMYV